MIALRKTRYHDRPWSLRALRMPLLPEPTGAQPMAAPFGVERLSAILGSLSHRGLPPRFKSG